MKYHTLEEALAVFVDVNPDTGLITAERDKLDAAMFLFNRVKGLEELCDKLTEKLKAIQDILVPPEFDFEEDE